VAGAKSLVDYKHPPRAFYIFGPEDNSLKKQITNFCRDTIYVPTNGCMNLAATVNVILYDRLAKGENFSNH
jgi:tRNA(Leu) C34 or U34 (ribose-2'-O)-methylase TrmL